MFNLIICCTHKICSHNLDIHGCFTWKDLNKKSQDKKELYYFVYFCKSSIIIL